jgi:hypothetical protein
MPLPLAVRVIDSELEQVGTARADMGSSSERRGSPHRPGAGAKQDADRLLACASGPVGVCPAAAAASLRSRRQMRQSPTVRTV